MKVVREEQSQNNVGVCMCYFFCMKRVRCEVILSRVVVGYSIVEGRFSRRFMVVNFCRMGVMVEDRVDMIQEWGEGRDDEDR